RDASGSRYAGNRGATHAVAAIRSCIAQATVQVLERIGRITRKDREVVALGRIQVDRIGIEWRLLARARPANAVADVAHHRYTGDALSRFTGQRTGATGRDDRHVAGVEVRPEGRNDPARGGRAARGWRVRRAGGVDVEGAVFLDDPTEVARIESTT